MAGAQQPAQQRRLILDGRVQLLLPRCGRRAIALVDRVQHRGYRQLREVTRAEDDLRQPSRSLLDILDGAMSIV